MINNVVDLDKFGENRIPGLRLYHDLNIYGDDVDDFFDEYQKLFDVTIHPFNFTDYFPEEGWDWSSIVRFFTGKENTYKELTIADLQKGIDNKELIL
ncbi:MAG: DUF1493 family protein [Tannerellaceae bacterium]|nr:DUF1493 family protein [Tannerellaceae bacterium]MCD8177532.1 DUF1493 family protein [Tannerellaceae bacterium]